MTRSRYISHVFLTLLLPTILQRFVFVGAFSLQSSSSSSSSSSLPSSRCHRRSSEFSSPFSSSLSSIANVNEDGDENNQNSLTNAMTRRSILSSTAAATTAALLTTTSSSSANAAIDVSSLSTTTTTIPSSSSITYISPKEADITHKVTMNVRISRQDGSFYIRDDLPDTPENQVFYGTLTFGLFGNNAPKHVERFLSFLPPAPTAIDDNPLPSYGRSQFTSIDEATGLIMGGKIPSLQVTDFGGSAALSYYGRLLPANLWIEKGSTVQTKVSHSEIGLLTHANFDVTPTFGITTRTDTKQLDLTHTVFGKLILDDSSKEFLSIVQQLPTYRSDRRPVTELDKDATLLNDATSAIFTAQRQFFRNTAKTFGDTRLEKVYEGKFLRRIEVTQATLVSS